MRERFSADPTVVFMTSVIEDLRVGKLQIPRFQRPLVWDWDQRRDLLSSIYEGLPIGALMIWLADDGSVGAYDRLGPYALPSPVVGAEHRYLMDGVQRVSTLFGALNAGGLHAHDQRAEGDDAEDPGDHPDFSVFVDLDAQRDVDRFLRRGDIQPRALREDPTRFLPLKFVLDSRDLLRFQRGAGGISDARVEASDDVATAFRTYKIPLITLRSASLELVTKSFERVNSRGAPMSELHMLNALSFSPRFHLLKREGELRQEELERVGWADVHQDVVLRCLKIKAGVELYDSNPDDVSDRLRQNPEIFDSVFQGIRRCAEFFRDEIGILSESGVPYRMQTVSISSVLMEADYHGIARQLADWFWFTTYTEAFGSSARQSENALKDFRAYFETGDFHWSLRQEPSIRPLSGLKLQFRSVRGKALAFALSRRRREGAAGVEADLLAVYGQSAFANMTLRSDLNGRAGCRFVAPPGQVEALLLALLQNTISPEERAQHFVSEDALTELLSGDVERFVSIREADIFEYEIDHVFGPAASRLGLSAAIRGRGIGSEFGGENED